MIKSIDEEIIVVSIVGKARTGKSYLMNLLLEQSGKGGVIIISFFNNF
jgi:GTPase Era involved in 16S rRNA processing